MSTQTAVSALSSALLCPCLSPITCQPASHRSPRVSRRLAASWSRFWSRVSVRLQRTTATLKVLTLHTSGLHAQAVTLQISRCPGCTLLWTRAFRPVRHSDPNRSSRRRMSAMSTASALAKNFQLGLTRSLKPVSGRNRQPDRSRCGIGAPDPAREPSTRTELRQAKQELALRSAGSGALVKGGLGRARNRRVLGGRGPGSTPSPRHGPTSPLVPSAGGSMRCNRTTPLAGTVLDEVRRRVHQQTLKGHGDKEDRSTGSVGPCSPAPCLRRVPGRRRASRGHRQSDPPGRAPGGLAGAHSLVTRALFVSCCAYVAAVCLMETPTAAANR